MADLLQYEKICRIAFSNGRVTKIVQGFNYFYNGKCVDVHGEPTERKPTEEFGWFMNLLWILDGSRYGRWAEKR